MEVRYKLTARGKKALAYLFVVAALIFAVTRITVAYNDYRLDYEMKKTLHQNIPQTPGQKQYCSPDCNGIIRI